MIAPAMGSCDDSRHAPGQPALVVCALVLGALAACGVEGDGLAVMPVLPVDLAGADAAAGASGAAAGMGGKAGVGAGRLPDAAPSDLAPPAKRAPGEPCAGAAACASGHCTDGVCCESACTGACFTCAAPNAAGRCVPVPGARPAVHPGCPDQRDTCGTTGTCNGFGVCERYPAPLCAGGAAIPFAATPPVADGAIDAAWALATPQPISRVVSGAPRGAGDASAQWRAVWSPEALFVLVEVRDDDLRNDSSDPSRDDSVELYVDADHSRSITWDGLDDVAFTFGWNDTQVIETALHRTEGVSFATRAAAGGYVVEARLPWSTLRVAPSPVRPLGIDVQVNDDDASRTGRPTKLSWWAGSDLSSASPVLFGAGVLLAPPR